MSMSTDHPCVVICDDEADLRATLGEYLRRRGYTVIEAANAAELHTTVSGTTDVDLVVLDIEMPGEDGLAALGRLRAGHDVAVIMLTASSGLVDRVVGLELGADDYLGKPFELRELEARIKSVLRRTRVRQDSVPAERGRGIEIGPHRLDLEGAELRGPDGRVIPLTPMEFRTLQLFVENRGRVLTRDRILDLAAERGWEAFDRSVDLRVSRLRRKIEPNPAEPTVIRTVRGIGYILDPASGRG
jgi:two-component system phosphate regulon response regulator OmpR